MEKDNHSLEDSRRTIEQALGYVFREHERFVEAMTHKSFSNEQIGSGACSHNERLEFLGDAVLELIVSDYIFCRYPEMDEGQLTRIRAEVVNEKSLARIGRNLGLGDFLLLGKGEAMSGGRQKASLIADAFEALLGAVFSDSGFEKTCTVVLPLVVEHIDKAASRKEGMDFKTRLQEWLQGRKQEIPVYKVLAAEGPDHKKLFTCQVACGGTILGQGQGKTKKAAEQEAARQALQDSDD
ncbi:MAG: ribonuclease III [Deltaproteobacteria bacterium]|nr:ribonuclease III [Deltaproteobacteria bacterium]